MNATPRTIDFARLLEERKLTPFNYMLIAISTIITLFDGLDMMMVSYTAPYMREELGLTNDQLGHVFSAGTAGMVFGGLIFTYIGDRIGRRPTILMTSLTFGVLTLVTGFARSYELLVLLRFLDGLAIGGLLPLAWALNIEFVPKRIRATVIAFIMMGFSFGSSAAGPMTNMLAPDYGWEGVYFAGGGATLICAIVLIFLVPESPRFLISKGLRPDLVLKTLRRYDPTIDVTPNDTLVLGDEGQHRSNFKFGDLFLGPLRLITPLIWIGYFASALGIFFKSNWGPIVLEAMDISRATAANASAIGGLLGAICGVLIMIAAKRFGLLVVAACTALIIPMALLIGFEMIPATGGLFLPTVVVQNMLVGGCHAAIISQLAIYYPSAIRASAGGWASAVGKVGGVVGPMLGAAVLNSGIPVARTYAIAAACPLVLVICVVLVNALVNRAGNSLGERDLKPLPAE